MKQLALAFCGSGLTRRIKDPNISITLNERAVPRVDICMYLGCVIEKEKKNASEVIQRFGMATCSSGKLTKVSTKMENVFKTETFEVLCLISFTIWNCGLATG